MIRSELVQLVEVITGHVVDPQAGTGLAAALVSAIARPDIVVIDVVDRGGEHDLLGIACASPTSAIVVFTARSDTRSRLRLVSAGARTVVAKGDGSGLRSVLSELALAKAA